MSLRIYFIVSILLLCSPAFTDEDKNPSAKQDREIQNLRAFAKLYGYVKYFHPSDEASAIDWDKFAIFGVKQVKDAKNTEELKRSLERLFLPVGPTIQIYTSGQKPEDPMKHLPEDTTGLKIVAWQHEGVGLLGGPEPYKSIRLNRENIIRSGGYASGVVGQSIDAAEYRGKEIMLKVFARIKVSGYKNKGTVYLKVIRNGKSDLCDNQEIKSADWQEYRIERKINDDAVRIEFGCVLRGRLKVWVDEFQLYTKDKNSEWKTIQIKDPGFEQDRTNYEPKLWTNYYKTGYTHKVVREKPYKGNKCLLIQDGSIIFSEKLFERYPKTGEMINKPLDSGLLCQVPLALYSDKNHTLGKNEKYPLSKLIEKLEVIDAHKLKANDEDVRLADVIIAWNVFQHFYPYFDVVNVDWDSELTNTIQKAMTDRNERDFYYTLCKLIAKLQDGHGRVRHPRAQGPLKGPWMYLPFGFKGAYLPFGVDWIENKLVVTISKEPTKVKKGDIIVSINGINAEQVLLDNEKYVSGSRQWKRVRSLEQFGYDYKGSTANLTIKRGSEIFQIQVDRNYKEVIYEPQRPKIEKIKDDIFYVDLNRVEMSDIEEIIDDLTNAKGVIFDLRIFPNSASFELLLHLLREKDTSDNWLRVPQIIYPDLENIVGFRKSGWGLEPKQPRIKGKVVFLTCARAISAAEAYLSFVEHYKLGEILGQPTAGANGVVNRFQLPGDFTVSWTGMKVLKRDGSQHHLIGIQPTVPVQRTIQGVIEGRDEYLEKALEIINK